MLKVLIVGCGNMGSGHARAYHSFDDTEITGLVSRTKHSRERLNKELGNSYPTYASMEEALNIEVPDIVCISTYSESHASLSILAMERGCHVFLEKPLAPNLQDAKKIIAASKKYNRKLVVGYILRVHPAWKQFVRLASQMGTPKVMRLNLNQQSYGSKWEVHKNLMKSTSPIVDCGVHYIDIMCQIAQCKPTKVVGMGARLTDEIGEKMYNYGQLQIFFEDGSVGWYESGWGPMMSETADFVKDVIGPEGSVSIINPSGRRSDELENHVSTQKIKVHSSRSAHGKLEPSDLLHEVKDAPSHDELCVREQRILIDAIQTDSDISHLAEGSLQALGVVLAADQSIKTGKIVELPR